MIGTVGMGFITEVATVIVTVAGPVLRDAAAAVALELRTGAGMAAACFIAVVPAVVICNTLTVKCPLAIAHISSFLSHQSPGG